MDLLSVQQPAQFPDEGLSRASLRGKGRPHQWSATSRPSPLEQPCTDCKLPAMTRVQTRPTRRGAGVRAWAVAVCLLLLAFAGMISRYVPAAEIVSQIGVLGLIVLGIVSLHGLRLPDGINFAAIVFLISSTVAAIYSAQIGIEYALRGWIGLVAAVFAAIATAGTVVSARSRGSGSATTRLLLVALGIGLVANVILGLKQAVLGMDSFEIAQAQAGVSTFESGDWIRLMGTFATNQDFGLLAGCMTPAVFVLALTYRGRPRAWLLVLTVALYGVVILSLTRTALIASVAAAAFGMLFLARGGATTRAVRAVVVGSSLIFLGAAVLVQIPDPRVQDAILRASTLFDLSEDVSFNARRDATLPRAIAAFQQAPFGSGAGAAGPVSQGLPFHAPFGSMTTDNGYLMIAIQVGIVGVVAFVLMLILLVRHLAASSNIMSKAASASIIALLVAMISAQYWALLAPISLVAAIVGVGIGYADPKRVKARGQVATNSAASRHP